MREIFESLYQLLYGTFSRLYFLIPTLIFTPIEIYGRLIKSYLPKGWQFDLDLIDLISEWGIYFWGILLACSVIQTYHEERKESKGLREKLSPKIEIQFDEDSGQFHTERSHGIDYEHDDLSYDKYKTGLIRLMNTSDVTVCDIEVFCVGLDVLEAGDDSLSISWVQGEMRRMLCPHEPLLVGIVQYHLYDDERYPDEAFKRFEITIPWQGKISTAPPRGSKFRIDIQAFGNVTPSQEASFTFGMDGKDFFFRKLESDSPISLPK